MISTTSADCLLSLVVDVTNVKRFFTNINFEKNRKKKFKNKNKKRILLENKK